MRRGCELSDRWQEDRGDLVYSGIAPVEVAALRPAVLLGLLTLGLIPRVWAATTHDILCPDAVTYVWMTERLEAGEPADAFRDQGLNLYPLVLLGLKRLSPDWLEAAKWWSVAMASLAVLPLYGWIRRQFHESLAVLGCCFYALHPAMVHDSPLVVRDPTFWLLLALGLYTSWRAVAEIRWRWFFLFGLVFGLAIHLRSEGWLLAPVLLLWALFRLRSAAGRRAALTLAALLAVAAGPVLGRLATEAVFAGSGTSPHGERRHFDRLETLIDAPVSVPLERLVHGTRRLAVRYIKAFGYLHGLMAIAGVVYWKRRIFHRSKLPLLAFCLLASAAIWVVSSLGEMDRRYVFPIVIASLPTIAAGFCYTANRCSAAADRARGVAHFGCDLWLRRLLIAGGVFLSAAILLSPRPMLHDQAEIGRWIIERFGPNRLIVGSIEETRLVGFYSRGIMAPYQEMELLQGEYFASPSAPDVLLFWIDWRNLEGRPRFAEVIELAANAGYREIEPRELPDVCQGIVVLARDGT